MKMSFEEYKSGIELIGKKINEIQEECESKIEYVSHEYDVLKAKYIIENAPCEIEIGDIVSVKWCSPFGRTGAMFQCAPNFRRYEILKEAFYVERFVFDSWKIDKNGNVIPVQCVSKVDSDSSDYIFSVSKEETHTCGRCESCEYFQYPLFYCFKRDIYLNAAHESCKRFYGLEVVKTNKCGRLLGDVNMNEIRNGSDVHMRNGTHVKIEKILSDGILVSAVVFGNDVKIKYGLDGVFRKNGNSDCREFDLIVSNAKKGENE